MSTHLYEYMYAHHILINNFKRLVRLDLEIYKINQKNISLSMGTQFITKRIISYKYIIPTLNLRFKPS
jgi:hypothetical protein